MKKKKTVYKPFDAAAYLDNDAVIAEYLSAAAEDSNPKVFAAALGDVARGMLTKLRSWTSQRFY
jgi:DNA-binding phage protein